MVAKRRIHCQDGISGSIMTRRFPLKIAWIAVLLMCRSATSESPEGRSPGDVRPDAQLEARREIDRLLDRFHPVDSGAADRMDADARRLEQAIFLIEQFLERYPNTPAREDLEKAKLRSVFLLTTIRGQTFDRLRSEAARVLAGHPPESLEHDAEYWKLRVDLALGAPGPSVREGVVTTQGVAEVSNTTVDHVTQFSSSMESVRLIEQLIRDADHRGDMAASARWLDVLEAKHDKHVSTTACRGRHALNRSLGSPWVPALETIDGRKIDWREYRGAIVAIVFWAPRHSPAMELMRWVRDFQAGRAGDALYVVAVAIDTDVGRVSGAIDELGVAWPTVCDLHGWASPWVEDHGIRGLPTTLLVDRLGTLRRIITPEADDVIGEVAAALTALLDDGSPEKSP